MVGMTGGKLIPHETAKPDKKISNQINSLSNNVTLETGMERDEDGVVLGSTRLSGSQRLHR
jgi:hypothetical protein